MFNICKKRLCFIVVFALAFLCFSFRPERTDRFQWIETCFKSYFDSDQGSLKLKRWELSVTNKGFFRLRKFYANGKQEYFSFNLDRFADLNYLGTIETGEIVLRTKGEDVIVQTYNDPKGNIDSMSNCLRIKTVHTEPEILDSLRMKLSSKSIE